VKSEIVDGITSHFYVAAASTMITDDVPLSQIRRSFTKSLASNSFNLRRSVSSRYGAVLLCVFSVSLLIILSQVEISSDDRSTARKILLILMIFFGSIFESCVIYHVRDRFGTVREFKAFAVVGLILVLVVIISDHVTNHFYGMLIRRWSWGITTWLLIVWLYFHIRGYSVDHLRKSQSTKYNFELWQIFGKKKSFEDFRKYSRLCLCAENVEFIVDIYAVRQTLQVDPWRALSKGETKVIKKLARVKMPWIDKQIKEDASRVPSMDRIFELYIKPYAEFEVNISGKSQANLMVSFNEEPPSAMTLLSKVDVQLSSAAYVDSSDETDHLTSPEGSTSERSSPQAQPDNNKSGVSFKLDNIAPEYKVGHIKLESVDTYKNRSPPKLGRSVKDLQEEHRLTKLYPVWKELVMLLNNDTFVRYKESLKKSEHGISVVL